MLQWGAQIDTKDVMGKSALHYLVQVDESKVPKEWEFQLDTLYGNDIEGSFDIDAATIGGVTPLMLAVKMNKMQIVY